MDFPKSFSFFVLLLCILIALRNQKNWFQNADFATDSHWLLGDPAAERKLLGDGSRDDSLREPLMYDYYGDSCPSAEQVIRSVTQKLFNERHNVAPALLRLVFHDCFIEGCDASILLDPVKGMESEKTTPPNLSLKGFDAIDIIKSELEMVCPRTVSCADTLVLAAREAVLLVGGPYYPLLTGRKDSRVSFRDNATFELPTPDDHFSKVIATFATRGFDERETLSLLGAHSTGTIHCSFLHSRLFNFRGTGKPDPSIDPEFREILRSKCNSSNHQLPSPSASPTMSPSPSPSSLKPDPGVRMDYEGPGKDFGMVYYRGLARNRGLLFVDQQMTVGDDSRAFVQAYASNADLFRRDFGRSMMKLSNLRPITKVKSEVRVNCRKVN